jgi:hypothetical protein
VQLSWLCDFAQNLFVALVQAIFDSESVNKLSIVKLLHQLVVAHGLPREFEFDATSIILSNHYDMSIGMAQGSFFKALKSTARGLLGVVFYYKKVLLLGHLMHVCRLLDRSGSCVFLCCYCF